MYFVSIILDMLSLLCFHVNSQIGAIIYKVINMDFAVR